VAGGACRNRTLAAAASRARSPRCTVRRSRVPIPNPAAREISEHLAFARVSQHQQGLSARVELPLAGSSMPAVAAETQRYS
jgi:hypothetical protein